MKHANVVDPVDLKTLAQFNLMADPSVSRSRPAKAAQVVPKGVKPKALAAVLAAPDPDGGRAARREALVPQGEMIGAMAAAVNVQTKAPPARRGADPACAVAAGAAPADVVSFDVERPGRQSSMEGSPAPLCRGPGRPGTPVSPCGRSASRRYQGTSSPEVPPTVRRGRRGAQWATGGSANSSANGAHGTDWPSDEEAVRRRDQGAERDTAILETHAGDLVLRRVGGNPFHDVALDALVGKTIRTIRRSPRVHVPDVPMAGVRRPRRGQSRSLTHGRRADGGRTV